ncbi:neuromedin-U receptor 2-like [Amphiura filiformis]|uniref:neuromedin-U receptor 2-like n=1 Tax=Amphiura filiformis TaxID=82378 RepID=UPI003B213673
MNASNNLQNCVDIFNFTLVEDAESALDRFLWNGVDELLTKVILPVVVCVGVLGNLAFLFTVARISRMRTAINYYLINLAVADIMFLLITMSGQIDLYTRSQFRGSVPYISVVGCWSNVFIVFLSYFASVILVTIVSLERYYSICKPIQHRLLHGKKYTRKLIVAAWIVAAVLAILCIPRFGKLIQECLIWPNEEQYQHVSTKYYKCFMVNFGLGLFGEIIQLTPFCFALIISSIAYYKLIVTLSKKRLAASEDQAVKNLQVRNQVARIIVIIGVVFFVCQCPSRVINLDKFIRIVTGTHDPSYGIIFVFSFGLLLINSAINPFAYGFGSRLYREAFYEAFGISKSKICLKKKRQYSLSDGSSRTNRPTQRPSRYQSTSVPPESTN